MAQQTKKKKEILQTPPGIAVFPYLNRPQPAHESSQDKTPSWKTGIKLKLDDPEVAAFMAELQRRYDENLQQALDEETPKEKAERERSKNPEKGADLPWREELDEAGQPTGYMVLTLKQKISAVSKKTGEKYEFFVSLFDAKGKPLDRNKVKIGGGSTIVCAFEVGTFNTKIGAGLSLRLNAVQVLDRVEHSGRDATGYGFKARDGFSAEELEQTGGADAEDEGPTGSATDDSI